MGLLELLVILVPFAFAAFLVWIAIWKLRGGQKQHADVQKEIVSKFSSGEELRDFLRSEEGRALFRDLNMEDGPRRRGVRERAISRIGVGIVLMVIGGGLLVLAHYADQPNFLTAYVPQAPPPGLSNGDGPVTPPQVPASDFIELPPGMGFPAVVLLLAGLGMILSSLITLKLYSSESSKT